MKDDRYDQDLEMNGGDPEGPDTCKPGDEEFRMPWEKFLPPEDNAGDTDGTSAPGDRDMEPAPGNDEGYGPGSGGEGLSSGDVVWEEIDLDDEADTDAGDVDAEDAGADAADAEDAAAGDVDAAEAAGTGDSGAGDAATEDEDPEEYHSPYDFYRFQTPEKVAGNARKFSKGEKGGAPEAEPGKKERLKLPDWFPREVKVPKAITDMNPLLKNVLIGAGMSAALIAIVIGIAFGVDSLRRKPEAEQNGEIVLGRQDEQPADAQAPEEGADSQDDVQEAGAFPLDPGEQARMLAAEAKQKAEDSRLSAVQMVQEIFRPSMVCISGADGDGTLSVSGVILGMTDKELLVATNAQAVRGENAVSVLFNGGTSLGGTVRNLDEGLHTAVVAVPLEDIPYTTLLEVRPAATGDTAALAAGTDVYAVGVAAGYGDTVSRGIVNSAARELTLPDGTALTVIQTDMAIHEGNNGGALLDGGGRMIGLNCMELNEDSREGTGFAIPVDQILPLLEADAVRAEAASTEEDAGFLGVTVITVPVSSTGKGMPAGVYVSSVEQGSPAADAEIRVGDIICAVDGIAISGNEDLVARMGALKAGDIAEMTIMRLNEAQDAFEELKFSVVLASKTAAFGGGTDSAAPEGSMDPEEDSMEPEDAGDLGGNYGGLFDEGEDFFEDFPPHS